MKLAILGTRGIPARYGGFETFVDELAPRLAAAGVDVTVFCPTSTARADGTYRGVRLRYVPMDVPRPLDQLFWDAKCFGICRGEYDVVYMLGTGGGFMAWMPRLWGATVWVNTDGVEWRRAKWGFAARCYIRATEALSVLCANRAIADSAAIARYLRKRYGSRTQVSTIAYGAYAPSAAPDAAPLTRWGLEPQGYYIVVCRLEPENHVREIIEGYERSNSAHPLVVLGSTDEPNGYVRDLLKRGGERVRFLGTVYERPTLAALRFHSRAYLHGHSVGGTNPSLLEAMGCENLVIAHDNEFNREVVRDAGLFFCTPADVAEQIRRLEQGVVDADLLRRRAREVVLSEYSWERIAHQYLDLLGVPERSSGRATGGSSA